MSPPSVSVYLCLALAIRGDLSLQSGFTNPEVPDRASDVQTRNQLCQVRRGVDDSAKASKLAAVQHAPAQPDGFARRAELAVRHNPS